MINYSVGLVTIAATNFDRAWKFYAQLFDQKPQPFTPQVYAGFRLPGICLGIFRPKDALSFSPGGGAISICLEVDNLKLAIAQAHQAGCQSSSEIMTASHGQEAYIYDPDGNRIILHQGKNASEQ